MNDLDKIKINNLRAAGMGALRISKETGISVNTIKSYCKRNGIKAGDKKDGKCCQNCGTVVQQIEGKRQRKFCSDKCRNVWWNAHLELVKRKAYYPIICSGCGNEFMAYGNRARKYCTVACYRKARFGGQ